MMCFKNKSGREGCTQKMRGRPPPPGVIRVMRIRRRSNRTPPCTQAIVRYHVHSFHCNYDQLCHIIAFIP